MLGSKSSLLFVIAFVVIAFALTGCSINVLPGKTSVTDITILKPFNSGVGDVTFGTLATSGTTGEEYISGGYFTDTLQVDSEGRIVVAGTNTNDVGGGSELAIWRYNPDGTLDTTFGGGAGYVTFGATGAAGASGAQEFDGTWSFRIDSEGRYVIAGYSYNSDSGSELAIWRYNTDGTLDSTFGNAGYLTSGTTGAAGGTGSSEIDQAWNLQIDSEDRLVLVGDSMNSAGGIELAIWRYNSDGTLDTSFGSGTGYVTSGSIGATGATGSSENDAGNSLQIDSEGRYVIAGYSTNTNAELAIWRFNTDGSLDTTFGSGAGYVAFGATGPAGGDFSNAYSLQIDSEDRLVIAGSSNNSNGGSEAAIWRYNEDGSLDTAFGNGMGYVISGATGAAGATGSSENDSGWALQIDSGNRLVVAGTSVNSSGGREIAIWRYNTDGSLDTTFGGTGIVTDGAIGAAGASGASEFDIGEALQIDSYGRLVIAGLSYNSTQTAQLAVWRYLSNGIIDE